MSYLDTWKELKLKSLAAELESKRLEVEAEHALKMHTAIEYGKGGDVLKNAQSAPAQQYQQPAPQAQPPANNGHSGIFCAKCNVELQDKPARQAGGAPFTAWKAAEYSRKKNNGVVLCYNCDQGR